MTDIQCRRCDAAISDPGWCSDCVRDLDLHFLAALEEAAMGRKEQVCADIDTRADLVDADDRDRHWGET